MNQVRYATNCAFLTNQVSLLLAKKRALAALQTALLLVDWTKTYTTNCAFMNQSTLLHYKLRFLSNPVYYLQRSARSQRYKLRF